MRSLTLVLIIMPMWSVDWSGVGIKGKRKLYLISASQELAQQLKQSRVFIPAPYDYHYIDKDMQCLLLSSCTERERERERISCMSRPFKLLDCEKVWRVRRSSPQFWVVICHNMWFLKDWFSPSHCIDESPARSSSGNSSRADNFELSYLLTVQTRANAQIYFRCLSLRCSVSSCFCFQG